VELAVRDEELKNVFVAATSRCFSHLPLHSALERLVDLEYTHVEIMIHENGGHLKPSAVMADLDGAITICRHTHRLTPIAYSVEMETSDESLYYQQFTACCKLAKSTKVVLLVVRAAELGTPFNAEVERLRELVAIAGVDGCRVALLTETGRMTQDPDTAVVLCDSVKGLCLALDPSHYICGPHAGNGFEQVMRHVSHVRLRDSKKDQPQVRVGQGEIEYGKLIAQLNKVHYHRVLTVDIAPMPEVDQAAELRKMRMLLESLL
jgi:sugar phosphate isomerase/epimerase